MPREPDPSNAAVEELITELCVNVPWWGVLSLRVRPSYCHAHCATLGVENAAESNLFFLTPPENFGLIPAKPPKSCKILISKLENLLSGINMTLKEFLFSKYL